MAEETNIIPSALEDESTLEKSCSVSNIELRGYPLNREKALKKKLQYTDRAHTQVTVTGGGLKIEFSTGMYELFKASAEQFYSSDSLPNKCQVTPVYDESGSHVETKYKLTSGRNGLYTFNLYHTKSSCLVNGKQVTRFAENDMAEIIKLITSLVATENISVTYINQEFKNILNECMQSKNCKNTVAIQETVPSTIKQSKKRATNTCNGTNDVDSESQTELLDMIPEIKSLQKLVQSVQISIKNVQDNLHKHMLDSAANFNEIKDVLQSLKMQNSLKANITDEKCDTVQTSVESIKQQLDTVSVNLQKKTSIAR